ncbi:DMT family transporter [Loigolactobacillus coryniformis]|uniref:DMT family transporter n=1 Tax=Loigolactobacillus coryniformis TaxID=1610 RepID=UPI00201A7C37|nr:DMT family transporter [Loigolactobacillus coryniformis]MCL5458922.1 DMT family transporter [Loigolactobacillus coryniformis]
MEKSSNLRQRGIILAIAGPLLWGFSGIAAQYLFTVDQVSPQWLVGIRMLGAGVLLLGFGYLTQPHPMLTLWHQPRAIGALLIFSFIGMLPAQLTYFMAIKYSNAATATILQFLSPVLIILYFALRQWRRPRGIDLLSMALALLGTFLLVTHGQLTRLSISPTGLVWGLLTALSTAIYTIFPRKLLREFSAVPVVGWSMLLGGCGFLPFALRQPAHLNLPGLATVAFVVVFGTLFAYLFILQSLRFIAPTVTSLLGAFEPLTSTILTVLIFQVQFGWPEAVGTLLILATTGLQALPLHPKNFTK